MDEEKVVKKRVLMCVSRTMVSMDVPGKGVHFFPTQCVEMSEDEMSSPQVQKLLRSKFLVDVTAAGERRNARAR